MEKKMLLLASCVSHNKNDFLLLSNNRILSIALTALGRVSRNRGSTDGGDEAEPFASW